ncbi:hypothetical protein DN614_08455 [Klebsiella michiganensis]|uniref:Uncharacterized protein n=1 Tax=Klebsiella michiganensis TaxID=1134687 RepID=A0A2J4R915_9ENTR|nr:hypothetical protein [Klebsiella michiganensis]PLL39819.1 hypothetical protein CWN50_13180 [Klebsiella michiganensis]RWS89149.1 hypothetical protein DN614_08455 [Klebsiella michiganensis]RXI19294.1 hypothetical protein DOD04_08755 [Klebsiella michiganensis]
MRQKTTHRWLFFAGDRGDEKAHRIRNIPFHCAYGAQHVRVTAVANARQQRAQPAGKNRRCPGKTDGRGH